MILYVNGDSHSYGHDAGGPSHSYGQHIANELGAEFICHAEPACSNDRIIRTTREYLLENRPDLLIIGWSSWERTEWILDGVPVKVTVMGEYIPEQFKSKHKEWVATSSAVDNEHRNYNNIWSFHQELQEQNIPHLFFNCYTHFLYHHQYTQNKHNWGVSYLNPYDKDSTYYFWLENQGFTPANPKFYHYGADAHKAWAQYLLTYIKKESIITT